LYETNKSNCIQKNHLIYYIVYLQDILEFIEQSPHGVVYFTFGSTVKMSSVPERTKKAFIDALAEIPQRVLLKYEDDIENLPKNIMIKKWLPQREILCNILMVITLMI